jgi:nitroreductase
MEFSQLVKNRYSVRDYNPKRPVPRDVLLRILEAGRLAPSAANRQPWRFVLISSPEMLARVNPCYDREWFRNAPHIMAVIGDRAAAWVRRSDNYNAIETDLTIAMDHLILAATNEGVGSCWIAAFDPVILRQALELKTDEAVFAITPLGYPAGGLQPPTEKNRKPLTEITKFI